MSMLIFGLVWTAFISLFVYMFFGTGGPIEVNGVLMSAEEAAKEPMLIIFFGIFFAVGLFLMIKGGKDVVKNMITKSKGVETFGMIVDIHGTGTRVNGRAELAADILTVVDGSYTDVFTEIIGFKRYRYKIGDFLKLKHYNKDVNIIAKVQAVEIPAHIFEVIQREGAGIMGLVNRMNMEEYPYTSSGPCSRQTPLNYKNPQVLHNQYHNSNNYSNFNNYSQENNQSENDGSFFYNNQSIGNDRNDNEIIINGKIYKKQ